MVASEASPDDETVFFEPSEEEETSLKREFPLTLHQSWHMMKNQNFSYYSKHRNVVGLLMLK